VREGVGTSADTTTRCFASAQGACPALYAHDTEPELVLGNRDQYAGLKIIT
jgi:hypothetical protein